VTAIEPVVRDLYGDVAAAEDVASAARFSRAKAEQASRSRAEVEDKALRRTETLGCFRRHHLMSLGDLIAEVAGDHHGAGESIAHSALSAMATELKSAALSLDAYVNEVQSPGIAEGTRLARETLHKLSRHALAFAELDSRARDAEQRARKAEVTP
jgi:hypothetical protein